MRKADQSSVNCQLLICASEAELQFALGLLTRLKADDLVTEEDRLGAIQRLVEVLGLARDVTSKQSSVSQGSTPTQ